MAAYLRHHQVVDGDYVGQMHRLGQLLRIEAREIAVDETLEVADAAP